MLNGLLFHVFFFSSKLGTHTHNIFSPFCFRGGRKIPPQKKKKYFSPPYSILSLCIPPTKHSSEGRRRIKTLNPSRVPPSSGFIFFSFFFNFLCFRKTVIPPLLLHTPLVFLRNVCPPFYFLVNSIKEELRKRLIAEREREIYQSTLYMANTLNSSR